MLGRCCESQNGEEAVGEFSVDDVFHELAERSGGELVDRDLPLELPFFAVDIEDSGAEHIVERVEMGGAFLLNVEMGLEHVLDRGGVGGDDCSAA